MALIAVAAGSAPALAQTATGPLFYDQRRLPDMEVERRNQEVIGEQRRLTDEKRRDAELLARKQAEDARQAQEEKRIAAETDSKRKKADEDNRIAAELEAKRKADDEKRVAAELEAKRKADDDRRVAAELETKRKADDERRVAAEIETKRKADDDNRIGAELEAKRKADEAKRVADAALTQKPQVAALVPAVVAPAAGGPCEAAKVSAAAVAGGLAQITVDSPCRHDQTVAVRYGAFDLARKLGSNGRASFALDMFLGAKTPVQLGFADGSTRTLALPAADLSGISKIALIWQAPVDLDLHAIEGGSTFGKAGHRWPGAHSSFEAATAEVAASGHGAGYISTLDDGTHDGARVEVYTFVHSPEQDSGAVAMLIDYASRGAAPSGDKCGSGALAEIPFDVVILDRKGKIQTESSLIPAQPCGAPLSSAARYLRGAVPDLRFRN